MITQHSTFVLGIAYLQDLADAYFYSRSIFLSQYPPGFG